MIKKIECIVRPTKLEEIKDALAKINIEGITVIPVKGFGRQKGHIEDFGDLTKAELLDKVLISIVTEEENVENVINIVQSLASTGKFGDGKIFVCPIEDVIRIRTKERGGRAIE